jgi:hypothetical protein
MSSKIAVWYHGLFYLDGEFLPNAFNIAQWQMAVMEASGLTDTADEIYCGVNGGDESVAFAETVFPEKSVKLYHGLQCHTEIRTIMHMQKTMTGRKGWKIFYHHCKGAFHSPGEKMIINWRNCMTNHLVTNWMNCVNALNNGKDSAGCHWLEGQVDGTMCLFGGNFFWVTSDFLNTLPPIENNPRIPIMGGVDAVESRFESEVILGTGPRMPKVRDFHAAWPFNCGGT